MQHVCHVPFGAHPYAVFNYYDYDPLQLKTYHESAATTRPSRNTWTFVYGVKNHVEYLEAVGGRDRLETLKARRPMATAPT